MARGSERTPVGKLNKRSFRYTRIWYTLRLVNFDRFFQHSSITDAGEIYDMATVSDLSTANASNAVFKCYKHNLKDFLKISPSEVPSRKTEGFYNSMVNERFFAIIPTGF